LRVTNAFKSSARSLPHWTFNNFHHPIRTMLVIYAFQHADKIRALLNNKGQPDIAAGTAPIWRMVWDNLQPTSAAMWAFDAGCAKGGRKYIYHILASKRLADIFEEGGQVDK
ncbi:hypothetical protein MPER_13498, partial [Moniliophthora perniciosa FA553]